MSFQPFMTSVMVIVFHSVSEREREREHTQNDPCLVFSLPSLLQRLHDFQRDTKTVENIPELTNPNCRSCVQISVHRKERIRLRSSSNVLPTGEEKTS